MSDEILNDMIARQAALEALIITFIAGMAGQSPNSKEFVEALSFDAMASFSSLLSSPERGAAAFGRLATARLENLVARLHRAVEEANEGQSAQ